MIESKLDPGRGPVVTILIQRGTLRVGDALVAGAHFGRVRAMHDFTGAQAASARCPGQPVEVLGFDGVPEAGEHVRVVENERRARQLAGERANRLKTEALARRSGRKVSLEDVFKLAQEGAVKELGLVVKADVAGLAGGDRGRDRQAAPAGGQGQHHPPRRRRHQRVRRDARRRLRRRDPRLQRAARSATRARSPSARASRSAPTRSSTARSRSCARRCRACSSRAEVETPLGQAEVRQLFRASRIGTIAGSFVTEGKVTRGAQVRVVRDGHRHLRHDDRQPAPLQRGRARGRRRLRVRHRAGELPGPARGRRARDLRDARRSSASCSDAVQRRCRAGEVLAGTAAARRGIGRGRMSTGRMRRVDEAIRQVIGDAVAGDLKDPRVGFVTVTDVRTSPDLRHARVYVSVLGATAAVAAGRARGDARGPAQRARLPAGRASPASCASSARRRSSSSTTSTTDRAHARRRADRRGTAARAPMSRRSGGAARASWCSRELREDERFVLATHENPDGDALGSLVGDAGAAERARQGLGDVHRARRVCRCRDEYRFFALDGPDPAAARRHRRAHGRVPRLRQHRPQLREACCATAAHLLNIDHHHDNTRFGTLNYVVPEASCTAEIVWDLMHGLGVRPTPDDRRGAVRRADHRHRALHVREHRRRGRT